MHRRLVAYSFMAVFAITHFCAIGQEVKRVPLPKNHPLIGSWKLDLPQAQCFEIYNIQADGTTNVISAAEASESEFEISLSPSSLGFYKWVDKITKNNGKPDCMGEVMRIGHVATNYIVLQELGKVFLLCEKEDLDTCVGPLVRQ